MADEAPDHVLPPSPAEGGEFTCPECAGHIFIQDKTDATKGRCVGYTFPEKEGLAPHPVECTFTWSRAEDHKHFKPKASTEPPAPAVSRNRG